MAAIGTAFIRVKPDTKGFEKEAKGGILGAGKKLAAGFAGAFAVVKIGGFLKGAIAEAEEASTQFAITQSVIKSMGNVAGISAEGVAKMNTALARKTGIDDALISKGSNVLLTFSNIRNEVGKGNDVFSRANSLAVDLSTVMGGDVKGAALQLGKALDNPIKGITALTRSGVSFDAQQQEQIKTLVKSGKTLDAQKIILAAVEKQVGGTAVASANTTDKLKVMFNEWKEGVGTKLLPVMDAFNAFLVDKLIPTVENFWRVHGPAITNAFKTVAEFVTGTVVPALKDFGDWINRNKDFLIPFAAVIGTVVAGFKIYAAIQKTVTAVTAAWNLVLAMNPIGLVVIAIAALAAGLVMAYQRSETFRNIVDGAFRMVAAAASFMWNDVLKPTFGFIVSAFLFVAEKIVQGAAKAFGWVPGIGPKLKAAATEFEKFRDDVNKSLSGIKDRVITVKVNYNENLGGLTPRQADRVGDGPGAGGRALQRIMPVLNRMGGYVTSTYRSPAENRRVGGSPTSYHMDPNNPAVDIGGPTSLLDRIHAALRSMGGWRELIWRAPGHYDHIHAADRGGVFQGPGMVWMGRGQETFASGLAAKKVSDLPAGGVGSAEVVSAIELLRGDVRALVRDYQTAVRAGVA